MEKSYWLKAFFTKEQEITKHVRSFRNVLYLKLRIHTIEPQKYYESYFRNNYELH